MGTTIIAKQTMFIYTLHNIAFLSTVFLLHWVKENKRLDKQEKKLIILIVSF